MDIRLPMVTRLGFSLIEMIICLFLLSIMLLSFDAMQIYSLRQAKFNYYMSVAMQQLYVMSERLRSVKDGDWHAHAQEWNRQNEQALPNGKGVVEGSYPFYNLSIYWGKQAHSSCDQHQMGQSSCLSLTIHL